MDLPDPVRQDQHVHVSVAEFIFRVLMRRFPVHEEARMLRIEDVGLCPLVLCLGDFARDDVFGPSLSSGGGGASEAVGAVDNLDGHCFVDSDSDKDCSPIDERWRREDVYGFLSAEDISMFQAYSVDRRVGRYWAARGAIRRYRVSKGKFGPRRRFKGGRFRELFCRKGPPVRPGGGFLKGFLRRKFVRLIGPHR